MKRRWIVIIIAIFVVFGLVIGALGRRSKRGLEVKTSISAKGDLVSYFSTSGTVESRIKKDYIIPNPQKVLKVNSQVGDRVKKGDVLVELEAPDMTIQLKTAQIQYDNAKLQLENLKKQKNNASQTQAQQNPMTQLSSGVDLDSQIKLQENQVELARLNLESVRNTINKQQRYVKADFEGIVTAVNVTEGGYTTMQLPVLTLEDNSSLRIDVNINQYDVSVIVPGQSAIIRFGNREFKGKVSSINPTATKVMSAAGTDTVIKAAVDVLENDGALKPGFDVDIDVKVGEKANVLKIPAEAVVTDKEGIERVYVVENGIIKIREIQTGLSSDIEEEVISGLNPGDKVVLNPSSGLKEGDRVTEKGEGK